MIPASFSDLVDVPPFPAPEARLVTARSYLIDRIVPDCEHILLPPKAVPGGQIRYRAVTGFPAHVVPGRRRKLARLLPQKPAAVERLENGVGIDLRVNSPENWAHFLINHLPLTFLLCRQAGLRLADVTLILPAATPGYIRDAAALLDLRVLRTDAAVTGHGIAFELDNWNVLRPARHEWVANSGVLDVLAPAIARQPVGPTRIFLPRKETRRVSNQPEIEALLTSCGYVTVYPETLDAAGQFALFHNAEEIVAVHGAGIAPLLYRQPDSRLRRLIEILPCGHMTDVYRVMSAQTGSTCIGVRGLIKPKYVVPAYQMKTSFSRYSLDSFEVDPVALSRAVG